MRILVTGGSGVVGVGTVTELVHRGHEVRLLARHARDDARQWPNSVTPLEGDVTDPASIGGAADECDAVLHIVGIVEEAPPAVTFERVNVGGTRNMLAEAQRAGVRRFVYVSSLGAPEGKSAYHRSKREAERLVSEFLDGLEEPQRLVFYLSDIEGLTAPEIASALEVNLNTVYGRLRQARKRFELTLSERAQAGSATA